MRDAAPTGAGATRAEIIGPDLIGADPAADEWFAVGDEVVIDPGGPNEEIAVIAGFGSLVFSQPLTNAHVPGEVVSVLVAADDGGSDDDGTGSVPPVTLPPTGDETRTTLCLAFLALGLGALVTLLSRRRPLAMRTVPDRPTSEPSHEAPGGFGWSRQRSRRR